MSFLWDKLVRPAAFSIDAERAHELGISALARGLASPFYSGHREPMLACERFGLKFASPVGIAAGFDKNGIVVKPLARLGFGFVEVGTVTARPQPGNPKPRLFRLPADGALINRLGFNNDGAAAVAGRIAKVDRRCVVGVNIGRNKDVDNAHAIENYLEAFDVVAAAADYVAVNVSSPNTPGLRDLQKGALLDELLHALQERDQEHVSSGQASRPLLVKIAPDLDEPQMESVVDAAVRNRFAGLIAANTTISRTSLRTDARVLGDGGLSGAPLRQRSTGLIRRIYQMSQGSLPIVGVGGVFSAEDALEKIRAGACLVQVYTGFVYGGPSFPAAVNRRLAELLRRDGFANVDEAVGTGVS